MGYGVEKQDQDHGCDRRRDEREEKGAAEDGEPDIPSGQHQTRSDERARDLKRKVIDVPAPRNVKGKPKAGDSKVKSKPIKIPHTLEVSDSEIIHSYDH